MSAAGPLPPPCLQDWSEALSAGLSACFFFRDVTFSTRDSRRPLMVRSLWPSREPSSSSSIPRMKRGRRMKKGKRCFKRTFQEDNSQALRPLPFTASDSPYAEQACSAALTAAFVCGISSSLLSPCSCGSWPPAASTEWKTGERTKSLRRQDPLCSSRQHRLL